MWAEIRWQIGEIVDRILSGGESFYAEELLIALERKGFLEDGHFPIVPLLTIREA
jgi:hypothetical protein